MNKLYTLLVFTCISMISFSQQIQIHWDQEPNIDQGGDTVYWTDGGSLIYPHLYVIDFSGSDQDLLWGRKIIDTQQGYSDQVCDDENCYIPQGADWTLDALAAYTLLADDSTDFLPKLDNAGVAGSAHFRYYVLTSGGAKLDSVDVKFECTVGTEELNALDVAVYPNPANDVFNVEINNLNGENVSVVLYNLLGDQVLTDQLVEGKNQMNISFLNNGVYFYSIIRNNDIVETKKLVVRH